MVYVHRSRDSHHVEVAVPDILHVGGTYETAARKCLLQFHVIDFQSRVMAFVQTFHPGRIHVISYGHESGGEQSCQRQSDIAKSYDGYLDFIRNIFSHCIPISSESPYFLRPDLLRPDCPQMPCLPVSCQEVLT